MSVWKEIDSTMGYHSAHHEYDLWESGVLDTLRVMPVSVLRNLTESSELGYFAKIVLTSKGETQ
jgi:hypothetical protein